MQILTSSQEDNFFFKTYSSGKLKLTVICSAFIQCHWWSQGLKFILLVHMSLWYKYHMNGEFCVAFSREDRRYEKWPDQSFQHVKGLCIDTKEQRKLEETVSLAVYFHQSQGHDKRNCCKYLQAKFSFQILILS